VFGELLRDGPVSMDLRESIKSFRMAGENTTQVTREAKILMDKINMGDGLVNKLINDSSYASTFDHTLKDLASTGANSKKMTDDMKKIISRINTQDNALGILLSDTIFAHKLRTTMDNAQRASLKLDQNMEALKHNFLLRGYFRKQQKKHEVVVGKM
jgi:phospholipid/cholesterol/gamma-HCH transport system substrate-binding protein